MEPRRHRDGLDVGNALEVARKKTDAVEQFSVVRNVLVGMRNDGPQAAELQGIELFTRAGDPDAVIPQCRKRVEGRNRILFQPNAPRREV